MEKDIRERGDMLLQEIIQPGRVGKRPKAVPTLSELVGNAVLCPPYASCVVWTYFALNAWAMNFMPLLQESLSAFSS